MLHRATESPLPKTLRPLSGLDALFVYLESMGTPMHVASLIRLEPPRRGRRDFGRRLADHLAARLAPIATLRRVLREAPMALGHPVWEELDRFDPADHLGLRQLPAPGSDAQLLALVARLHAEPLDRTLPLWRIEVIEGLASGEIAVYLKSHHALVDGQAGVQLTGALLDVVAAPLLRPSVAASAAQSDPLPTDALARAALRATAKQFSSMLRGLPANLKTLARGIGQGEGSVAALRESVFLAPRTPFNVQLGPLRRFATASLPLDRIKRVARAHGASLNDVVMALCAGALRAYLLRRRALPEAPLVAAMPVSLRQPGVEGGNEVSMVQCPLATDQADPLRRLGAIVDATRQIKGRVAAFRGLIPTDFPGLAAPLWATGASRLWQRGRLSERLPPLANLVISNVPGPPVPLFMGGLAVRHFHPVSIVTHGLGVNITLLSYAGQLEFGIVSTPETMDRPDALVAELRRALDALDPEAA